MYRFFAFISRILLGCGLLWAPFVSVGHADTRNGYSLLYSFYANGMFPEGGLISDESGDLYGTTFSGGDHGLGTVFKIAPDGTETVLYSFCPSPPCTNGMSPDSSLTMDSAGNFYGTTYMGGGGSCEEGCGVVFKLAPDGSEIALYSFCSEKNCADGAVPSGNLIFDSQGNIYGTAAFGGNTGCTDVSGSGCGTVFKLSPPQHGETQWTETTLYAFCPHYPTCGDGSNPGGGLVADKNGNFYGTTGSGGTELGGTVFKVTPRGKETVVYKFCSRGAHCSDGDLPSSGLVMDHSGSLYGETFAGGSTSNGDACCGVVFKLDPENSALTVLYAFCALADCTDGKEPSGGLIMDEEGNIYGSTGEGGVLGDCSQDYACGTIFKLTPDRNEKVLHSFCSRTNCADGSFPYTGVIRDKRGNLYGTTLYGGNSKCSQLGCGTVFEIKQ
jgi:uncharacterized repeat protein (TIGR03803 family)